MIQEPVEVEKALIHDAVGLVPLVLNDHRIAFSVEAESVDSSTMLLAGAELARDEADSKQYLEIALKEGLEGLLVRKRKRPQLDSWSIGDFSEVRHFAVLELSGELPWHLKVK